MRNYLLTAAILAASVCAPPARVPLAEDIHQPGATPSVSTGAKYTEDTWQTVLPYQDIQAVLGKEVRSSAGRNLGRIVDVLVDQSGQVRAAVIDFGGFLGVGARRIVVDWSALHFAAADQRDRITLDLTRDQIKAAPEYRAGKPVIVLTAVPEM
jgi:sporulation protein YlmC with PRC-barrel domain